MPDLPTNREALRERVAKALDLQKADPGVFKPSAPANQHHYFKNVVEDPETEEIIMTQFISFEEGLNNVMTLIDSYAASLVEEAEALEVGEKEVAQIASSALAKASQTRKITQAGINGLQHCPGFDDQCGLERDE